MIAENKYINCDFENKKSDFSIVYSLKTKKNSIWFPSIRMMKNSLEIIINVLMFDLAIGKSSKCIIYSELKKNINFLKVAFDKFFELDRK